MLFLYPWKRIDDTYYFYLYEPPYPEDKLDTVETIEVETENQKRFLKQYPSPFIVYKGDPKPTKICSHIWLLFDHFEYFNYDGDDEMLFTVEAARILHIHND